MNAHHEKDIVVAAFVDMALLPSMVKRIRVEHDCGACRCRDTGTVLSP